MKATYLLAAFLISSYTLSASESNTGERKQVNQVNVGRLNFNVYADTNFEADALALKFSECKNELKGYQNNLKDLTYSDDGKCIYLNQSWSGLVGSVCEGDSLNANDKTYRILEVTQTVLGKHDSNNNKIACATYRSPLVRMQDQNGNNYTAESFELAQLGQLNKTHIVNAYGDVCGGAKAMVFNSLGKKCAVESATKRLNKTCSQLNGTVDKETIKVLKIRCDMDNPSYTPGCAAELEATCNF